ncbi:MAG: radical SAM protein [Planctomycetota bacterium]|jgi:MoaA/NifB/PqqE/SkfB family radical SAM enzyme
MKVFNFVLATTGPTLTNLKILSRYGFSLSRHVTPRRLVNFARVEWARFRGKDRVGGFPYVLKIESTNVCNQRCPFCLDRDRSKIDEDGRGFGRMHLECFQKIVDVMAPTAMRLNLYGSGEPVLYPEIYDMIRYAADRNIGVTISANLSVFKKENAERLVLSGLEHLIVSCHGASPETYDKYNIGGDFWRTIENMKAIVDAKKRLGRRLPFVDWQFLRFSHNQHEIPKARQMAKDIGVNAIRFINPNIPPEHKAEWRPRRDDEVSDANAGEGRVNASPGVHMRAEDEAVARGEQVAAKAPKADVSACSWLYRSIFFNWDGGVLPCCDGTTEPTHDLGHFSDKTLPHFTGQTREDFERFWNGETYRYLRRVANFKVPREEMDKRWTCSSCIKPHMPFVLYERGFKLDPAVERQLLETEPDLPARREAWKRDRSSISNPVVGDR